jgi:general secretion pathway protein I
MRGDPVQRHGNPAQRGFTLLEVLVAFVIAALALGVLFNAASGGLRGAHLASHVEQAVARARSRLAAIGHGAPLVTSTRSGDDGGGFRWQERIAPVAALANPAATLYDVVVTISWRSDGTPRAFALHTRLTEASPTQRP